MCRYFGTGRCLLPYLWYIIAQPYYTRTTKSLCFVFHQFWQCGCGPARCCPFLHVRRLRHGPMKVNRCSRFAAVVLSVWFATSYCLVFPIIHILFISNLSVVEHHNYVCICIFLMSFCMNSEIMDFQTNDIESSLKM